MVKKFAIPTINGLLDEHFGHCSQFILIDTKDNKISGHTVIDAPAHEPGILPIFLSEKGITDVIVAGIGQKAIQIFHQHKINVFAGAPKLSARELVEGKLNNTLAFSANYCDH